MKGENYPADVKQPAPNPEGYPVILVVDDDASAMEAVVKLLSRRGFYMITAADGMEALEVLDSRDDVEVVVMDVMMPRMTGLEACRHLRGKQRTASIPIILLTGCDDVATRSAGMKLGVSEFLCKPFTHHELMDRINAQLHAREISRQLASAEDRLQAG